MSRHTADVVIVGGGLIGVWTAFFLARREQRVVLIEKGVVGAQSSGTNFGNLRLQGRFPGQYPLSLRSQALWEEIEALIGEDCEFAQTGHLYLAYDDEEERNSKVMRRSPKPMASPSSAWDRPSCASAGPG